MGTKIYLDTETIGLVGNCKLVQYSTSLDPENVRFIPLFKGWEKDSNNTTRESLNDLFELLDDENNTLVGYNLSFDCFQLYKIRHLLSGFDIDSRDNVVKPLLCKMLDLQLHSVFKSILAPFAFSKKSGNNIARLKRVPAKIHEYIRDYITHELNEYIKTLTPIGVEVKPHVHEVKDRPDLVDLSWTTNTALRLKTLMKSYGVMDTMTLEEGDWLTPANWKEFLNLLPDGFEEKFKDFSEPLHLSHGSGEFYDELEKVNENVLRNDKSPFWKYAKDDIIYLTMLEKFLNYPESDVNDYCADCVAYTRYHGFPLDVKNLDLCLKRYEEEMSFFDLKNKDGNLLDPNSPKQILEYIQQDFSEIKSSGKKILMKLAYECDYEPAEKILKFRKAFQRSNQIKKIMESKTGRGHPDFKVLGTATGRMAGVGGVNWQGMSQPEAGKISIRDCVLTSFGGDMTTLEVVLAAIIYEDDLLAEEITKGLDLHTLNTVSFHPKFINAFSYEEALRIKEDKKDPRNLEFKKARDQTKAITFATLYGAEPETISENLGLPLEVAREIIDNFYRKYIGIFNFKQKLETRFCTGDTETWSRESIGFMEDGITDKLGHHRKWTLEARIADIFWRAASDDFLPSSTDSEKIIRTKTKGPQTLNNATRSALLGAALTIQKSVARQATNSIVQSVGAKLTKILQIAVYRELRIPVMQVHDELQIPKGYEDYFEGASLISHNFIKTYSQKFKNLGFSFDKTQKWSDK